MFVERGQKTAMTFVLRTDLLQSKIWPKIGRIAGPGIWRIAARAACIAGILVAIGSCTTALPGTTAAGAEPAASRGTILAIRPVLPGGAGAGVLNGLAASPAPAGQPTGQPTGQAMDFIVREAGGGTISIVQPDAPSGEPRFQVGDPVVILRGDRTRLARPGP
jgi:hypothetical protein